MFCTSDLPITLHHELFNQLFLITSNKLRAMFLHQAISDVEKAIVEALDKQYAEVVSPLKENLAPKKFGLKYMQKLAKRSVCSYTVPDEVKP